VSGTPALNIVVALSRDRIEVIALARVRVGFH
jgi:hypothetical protein